jgi:hypothetical protein
LIWRRGFNLVHIILLVANCLLLVAIFHVWWGEEAAPVQSRAGKGPEVPRTPMLRDSQPLNAFRVVSTKNLFSQDRTGPDLGATAAKTPSTLEGKQLLGTIIIGEERVALISSKSKARGPRPEPEVQVVRLGEQWEGFKVVEISSEAVTFQGKDGKKTLNFPD